MIHLTPEQRVFVTERHVATLATVRADGAPHVVPIAFTWDAERGLARMFTPNRSVKVRNIERQAAAGTARAALCQVDGGRWLTLEGTITVFRDPAEVAEAVRRHAVRYPPVDDDPERVALHLRVDRVMGSEYMTR